MACVTQHIACRIVSRLDVPESAALAFQRVTGLSKVLVTVSGRTLTQGFGWRNQGLLIVPIRPHTDLAVVHIFWYHLVVEHSIIRFFRHFILHRRLFVLHTTHR